MRCLIACERSGVVRDAFRAWGHEAWSCDLEPDEKKPGTPFHLQVDALQLAWNPVGGGHAWDLMVAHPPCTYLCRAGARWWKEPGRAELQEAAIAFAVLLWQAPVKRIAIENPPGCLGTRWRPADQYVQPWQHGHPEAKMTGLWLRGLPLLKPTKVLPLPACGYWENQTPSHQNKLGPSPERAALRAKTYQGVANAFAEQWGAAA